MTQGWTVVALVLLLAGCSAPNDGGEPAGQAVTLVTDPSQGRMDPSAGAHLHDYWGSNERKTVLDTIIPIGTLSSGPAQAYSAAVALPEPGDVVPQGAATVEVTLTWTPSAQLGATNEVGGTRLAIRTAADRDAQDLGPIASGQMVVFNSTNERNDLPHQVLSAWEFHWVLEPVAAGGFGLASFQGELAVHVEAVRGLEIPLYPGHPDQWLGRTEFDLFQAEGMTVMDGDTRTGDVRCYGSCPPRLVPGDGVVVPINAHHVRVTLDRDTPMPTRLGLAYHDAVTRDWVVAQAVEETATSRIYVIDVLDGGDGAYTRQSNWEFALIAEEPVENGYVADSYRIAATVHRLP
ncbi:MAG: hypothetical protein WC876_11975 [Candidatus Thermoplasmatota archaeon]|jgi:hypothetical protein